MRVLLEFEHFCLLIFKFTAGLIRIRVLLEGESYLRIYGIEISLNSQVLKTKVGEDGKTNCCDPLQRSSGLQAAALN